jgi:hypothetical protein
MWRAGLIALGVTVAGGVGAQVPSVVSPGFAVDAMESIGSIADVGVSTPDGGVFIKALTVPAGRAFRLTDLTVDTRNANTNPNPCFFEIWRGTDAAPVARAWQRARVFGSATYDRSWITGPQFNAGEVVWLGGRFDPLNAGLRICSRADVNLPTELRYALRGYLVRQISP